MLVRFAFLVVVVFAAAAVVVVVVIFVQSSLALVLVFLFSVVLVCAAHCPLTAPRCHFSDFFFSLSGALIIRRLFSSYSIIHSLFATTSNFSTSTLFCTPSAYNIAGWLTGSSNRRKKYLPSANPQDFHRKCLDTF